jgi:hypothetical protein
VGDGEADSLGEGEASAFFFLLNLEDGEVVAEVVLVFFPVFVLVDPARVAVGAVVPIVSSFFWAWQPTNAAIATAVIKVKTDVFIGVIKLNEPRECRSCPRGASTKIRRFLSSLFSFSRL